MAARGEHDWRAALHHKADNPHALSIIVVGGGIGGLAAGRALALLGHHVQILDRDTAVDTRSQGYHLGLRANGIAALRQLGLLQAVRRCAFPEQNSIFHTVKPDGTVLMTFHKRAPTLGDEPSIDEEEGGDGAVLVGRGNLRHLLLQGAIDAGADVVWDAAYTSIEAVDAASTKCDDASAAQGSDSGLSRVPTPFFRVKTATRGDFLAHIVIGADGNRSKLRADMLGDPLVDVQSRRIGGRVAADRVDEVLAEMRAFSEDKKIVMNCSTSWVVTLPGGCLYVGVRPVVDSHDAEPSAQRAELSWGFTFYPSTFPELCPRMTEAERLAGGKPTQSDYLNIRKQLLAVSSDWHPAFHAILRASDVSDLHWGEMYTRDMYASGVIPTCYDDMIADRFRVKGRMPACMVAGSRCVTLMGDAAHPMTPFAGQGANQALVDAIALAMTLKNELAFAQGVVLDAPSVSMQIHAAIRKYETEMLARSAPCVKASLFNMRMLTMQNSWLTFTRDVAMRAMTWFTKPKPLVQAGSSTGAHATHDEQPDGSHKSS